MGVCLHTATELPLHGGKAPRWLFDRMVKLSRSICTVVIDEFGPDDLLTRLSDSNWFQALSCAVGYDWHSSGTTTVLMGALKEALNDTGCVYIAGGKGKTGLMTPTEIEKGVDVLSLQNSEERFKEYSRLSAKVDSAMVYDNISIYHHTFIFAKSKRWAVVQQAMLNHTNKAVRFQWLSDNLNDNDVVNEPHASVSSPLKKLSLDLTSNGNKWARDAFESAIDEYDKVIKIADYPSRHDIIPQIDLGKRGIELIRRLGALSLEDYKGLLLTKGVGRATLRSLAFVASLIYDKDLSYRDPITYAYNLGGKDGIPFNINTRTYDSVIDSMKELVDMAHIENREKYALLKRLNHLTIR